VTANATSGATVSGLGISWKLYRSKMTRTQARHPSHDRGWRGVWGLLLQLFVCLLGACGYWVITTGVSQAFADGGAFPLFALITILIGLCIVARITARQFRSGIVIDRRNYIDLSRAQWFKRRGEP
jgi:hypothetical protein